MKVLLLAGGYGTRLSEETSLKPKPMVEIGGKPIIWHIMKYYSLFGFNEFVILCGYMGHYIKEYFYNYTIHRDDFTIDIATGKLHRHRKNSEHWKVTLLDTGHNTMTGGRILRAREFTDNKPFLLTYGDGLSDIDINQLINDHQKSGAITTMTCVQPDGRFGAVKRAENGRITSFLEKPRGDGAWINGGFFVCNQEIFQYLKDDTTVFEQEPLSNLAGDNQLHGYLHRGFWKPMDTLRDKNYLDSLLLKEQAPWVKW